MNGPTLTTKWTFAPGYFPIETRTTFAAGLQVTFQCLSSGRCRLSIENYNWLDFDVPCDTGQWLVTIALDEDWPANPPTSSATVTINGVQYARLANAKTNTARTFLTGAVYFGSVSNYTIPGNGVAISDASVGGWDNDGHLVDLTGGLVAFAIRPPAASPIVRFPIRGADFTAAMTTASAARAEVTVFRRSHPGEAWSVAHRLDQVTESGELVRPWVYSSRHFSYTASVATDDGVWREDKAPLGWGSGYQPGMSVNTAAEILGLQVTLTRSAPRRTTAKELTCQFLIGGTPVGENRSDGRTYAEATHRVIYGGPTDLWGRAWTPSELNSSRGADLGLRLEGTTDNAEPVVDATVEVFYRFREDPLYGAGLGTIFPLSGTYWLPRLYAVEPFLFLFGVDTLDSYVSVDDGENWERCYTVPSLSSRIELANGGAYGPISSACHDPLDGRTWGAGFAWTGFTGLPVGEKLVVYQATSSASYPYLVATTPRAASETNNRPWPFAFRRSDGRLTVGCLIGNRYREWRADDPAGKSWTEVATTQDWALDAGELDCVSFAEGRSGEQALIGWHPATQSVHVLARDHEDAVWHGPYQPQAVSAAVAPYLVQNPDGTWERGWYLKGEWTQQTAVSLDAGWGSL